MSADSIVTVCTLWRLFHASREFYTLNPHGSTQGHESRRTLLAGGRGAACGGDQAPGPALDSHPPAGALQRRGADAEAVGSLPQPQPEVSLCVLTLYLLSVEFVAGCQIWLNRNSRHTGHCACCMMVLRW